MSGQPGMGSGKRNTDPTGFGTLLKIFDPQQTYCDISETLAITVASDGQEVRSYVECGVFILLPWSG